ncbi:MAG: hypothetical protein JKY37_19140 [Nannocystaceae bacterium]|nr:hypothetical protein [Nannocystaceae bacterium]
MNETKNEALVAQVRMAFLSGKPVRVYWQPGACAGSSPAPHYIKIYK